MACYVVGDLHGSICGLNAMLDKLQLEDGDQIYFVGDLVGKGEDDWSVLNKIASISGSRVALGNHDLYFLKSHYLAYRQGSLSAAQKKGYEYLLAGSLAMHHTPSDTLMVHAGIWPGWSLKKVLTLASEIEAVLRDHSLIQGYFDVFYGNEDHWDDALSGWGRVRAIINIFTRMRMLDKNLHLDFEYTGRIWSENEGKSKAMNNEGLVPWFNSRDMWPCKRIVFGHWAMLNGQTGRRDCINIDKGYVYGGSLLALSLDTGRYIEVRNPKGKAEQIQGG